MLRDRQDQEKIITPARFSLIYTCSIIAVIIVTLYNQIGL